MIICLIHVVYKTEQKLNCLDSWWLNLTLTPAGAKTSFVSLTLPKLQILLTFPVLPYKICCDIWRYLHSFLFTTTEPSHHPYFFLVWAPAGLYSYSVLSLQSSSKLYIKILLLKTNFVVHFQYEGYWPFRFLQILSLCWQRLKEFCLDRILHNKLSWTQKIFQDGLSIWKNDILQKVFLYDSLTV